MKKMIRNFSKVAIVSLLAVLTTFTSISYAWYISDDGIAPFLKSGRRTERPNEGERNLEWDLVTDHYAVSFALFMPSGSEWDVRDLRSSVGVRSKNRTASITLTAAESSIENHEEFARRLQERRREAGEISFVSGGLEAKIARFRYVNNENQPCIMEIVDTERGHFLSELPRLYFIVVREGDHPSLERMRNTIVFFPFERRFFRPPQDRGY